MTPRNNFYRCLLVHLCEADCEVEEAVKCTEKTISERRKKLCEYVTTLQLTDDLRVETQIPTQLFEFFDQC